jgi:hypothetical protein
VVVASGAGGEAGLQDVKAKTEVQAMHRIPERNAGFIQ